MESQTKQSNFGVLNSHKSVLLRKCISVHSIRISRFPTYDENYLHGDLALLQFDVSIIFTQKVLNTSNKNLFALQKGLPFKGIQIIYGLFCQFPFEKSLNEKLRKHEHQHLPSFTGTISRD
jgi:hypothetical protein